MRREMSFGKVSARVALGVAIATAAHVGLVGPLTILGSNRAAFTISPGRLAAVGVVTTVVTAALLTGYFLWARRSTRLFALSVAVVLYLYAQFYLLVWDYGSLDGSRIRWSEYPAQAAIEVACLAALLAFAWVGPRQMASVGGRLLVVAVVIQAVFVTLAVREAEPRSRSGAYGRLASIDVYSKQGNVILLLLDTLQTDHVEMILNERGDIRSSLDGFQVFRNTTGVFPFTALSVPAIVSGHPYEPGERIADYRREIADASLDRFLSRQGYRTSGMAPSTTSAYLSSDGAVARETAKLYDTAIFRQTPHLLKPQVLNDYRFVIGPTIARATDIPATDGELDLAVTRKLIRDAKVDGGPPTYKFLHLHGAHAPLVMDKTCKVRRAKDPEQGYAEQAECTLDQAAAYMRRLRAIGVYDRSLIVLLADHGSQFGAATPQAASPIPDFVMSSAQPALAIKPIAGRGPITFSDAPASLLDVYPTVIESLGLSRTDVGLNLLSDAIPADRVRRYLYFKGAHEAGLERLPETQEYWIRGNVHDPNAWHVGERISLGTTPTIDVVDLGDLRHSHFLDLGWVRAKPGARTQWTRTGAAGVVGRLPNGERLTLTARVRSPWEGQRVDVVLDGQRVATWTVDKTAWPNWQTLSASLVPSGDADRTSRIEFRVAKSFQMSGRGWTRGVEFDWIKVAPTR